MTAQTHEAIVQRMMHEAFNIGNLAVIDQVSVSTLCVYYPQAHAPLCGVEQVIRAWSQARAAFPDAYVMIEDTIAAVDQVVVRWTMRATHIGTFWGIPPTGQLVTWTGVMIYRFVANRISEIWMYADALNLLQQLERNHAPS